MGGSSIDKRATTRLLARRWYDRDPGRFQRGDIARPGRLRKQWLATLAIPALDGARALRQDADMPQRVPNLAEIVAQVVAMAHAATDRGTVASYIPALARVDPRRFGIAVATADGRMYVGGDADTAFSIQSVSKVFALTLALDRVGAELWKRVGVEPSGTPFNSIVQLEPSAVYRVTPS